MAVRPSWRVLYGILRSIKSRTAGMTMEAVLVAPLFVFCIAILFSLILSIQDELIVAHALDQTAEEISMLVPLIESGAEALPGTDLDGLFARLIPPEEEYLWRASIDLASSLLLNNLINRRVDYWISGAKARSKRTIIATERKILLEWFPDGKGLLLNMKYKLRSDFFESKRETKAYVPLWTRYTAEDLAKLEKTEKEESAEDLVWTTDNFTRGRYFRERAKANLPFNHPVISRLEGHSAYAVRSIDLTAPTYSQAEALKMEVDSEISRLAGYQHDGLGESKIDRRVLLLYVPTNSPVHWNSGTAAEMLARAAERGVELQIEAVGKSTRYESHK